tara:strand:+ start:9326 stop:10384 length:1059 start_codon:yes stop_codon:yes gene_type:complete
MDDDYSKSVIYKLVCKNSNVIEFYIGSAKIFIRRMSQHSRATRKKDHKRPLYKFIKKHGGFYNWEFVILEHYPCENRTQLTLKEQEYINLYNTSGFLLNVINADKTTSNGLIITAADDDDYDDDDDEDGDEDFSNSVIYKLLNENVASFYIGSTKHFYERYEKHRKTYLDVIRQRAKHQNRMYSYIQENGGFYNWKMIILEKYPCNNRKELVMREQEYLDALQPDLNSGRAYISTDDRVAHMKDLSVEYYNNNKEKMKENGKKWRENHKEEIKECRAKYQQEHKEEIKERNAKYYKNNRDRELEKKKETTICECGCKSTKSHLLRHKRRKIHIKRMAAIKIFSKLILKHYAK